MSAGVDRRRRRARRGRPRPTGPGAVGAHPLARRVLEALDALGGDEAGDRPLIVALSGGLDSCTLLHILRFSAVPGRRVVAAHFDHGMRPDSDDDAHWVAGLCHAWEVPLASARAERAISSEDEARAARYRFFDEVREARGAWAVATAHHADDQAETVLFRAVRGTGLAGLRGIPARRPGVVRPLLGVWREELVGYAERQGLRWRDDPTNVVSGFARNVLRNDVLPRLEADVAPGARHALVRLGALAAENEAAWEEVLPTAIEALGVRFDAEDGTVRVDRGALGALGPALRARVLRDLADDLGFSPDASATRRAVDFVVSGRSGGRVELGGGLVLARELDRFELRVEESASRAVSAAGGRGRTDAGSERALEIPSASEGSGRAVLGARVLRCSWRVVSEDEAPAAPGEARFAAGGVSFPLLVRARRPGDRIRSTAGTQRLKKLLLEARVPPSVRDGVPVLVDATGRLLWVPGVARTADIDSWDASGSFVIRIEA